MEWPFWLQVHHTLFVFNQFRDLERCASIKARRIIAKVEWHPRDLFPRAGFAVTRLPMEPDWIICFYNQRGTVEQHFEEGK